MSDKQANMIIVVSIVSGVLFGIWQRHIAAGWWMGITTCLWMCAQERGRG